MQEKEYIMVVRRDLKTTHLGITVRHHPVSLVMPNSYPRDGIFNPRLTTIKASYRLVYQDVLPVLYVCVIRPRSVNRKYMYPAMVLSFRTDKPGKTV